MTLNHKNLIPVLPRRPVGRAWLVVLGATVFLFLPVMVGVLLGHKTPSSLPAATPDMLVVALPKPTAADTAAHSDGRIEVMRDGQPVSISNGQTVDLGDGFKAQVSVSPYPPTKLSATLDLYVTDPDGKPVSNAGVDLKYDMLYMSHSRGKADTNNQNNGHYLAPMDFEMFGPWALDTQIALPGHASSVRLPIVIYVWR